MKISRQGLIDVKDQMGNRNPYHIYEEEAIDAKAYLLSVCRVDCSGRRVASLDVDGVIKVWSFNPIMQTKASSISKSPLLSLEWATKRDRLVSSRGWGGITGSTILARDDF